MKDIVKLKIGIAVLALVASAGALVFLVLMPAHFNPAAPAKDYPKPSNALEAQRQDLDYFRKLTELDRSYSPAARAEAGRRISSLEQSGAALGRPQLRVALMQIAALADNGHTRVGYDPGAAPMELPVRVKGFSDGIYVMRAADGNAELLGGRVVAIDGHPIGAVIAGLRQLKGGAPGWRQLYAELYMSWQDALAGLGIAPDMQHSTWTVIAPTGATVTRTLRPYAPGKDEPLGFPSRWYSSEPLEGLSQGWEAYQPDHALPIALRDFDTHFRRARLPGSCTMLIQFKSNEDAGGEHIRDFVAATEADMRAKMPCNVILDLRFNNGGDYTNTASFAKDLLGLVASGGRVYVLTSPGTFSAGITMTALVKEAGGDRVIILGEPVGDRLAFFSEGNRGCLPNYPLCMFYMTGKHDYSHPCTDLDVCYWLNFVYPVRVKTLDPDETITVTFADWTSGRDPVFERALELGKGRTAPKAN